MHVGLWIFLPGPVLCGVLGALVLYLGLRELRSARSLVEHGVRTTGEVVGFRDVSRGDSFSVRCPLLRFQTVDGRTIQTLIQEGKGFREVTFGQVVPLVYDAGDPGHATLGTVVGSGGYFKAAFYICVGSLFLLGGLVFLGIALALTVSSS